MRSKAVSRAATFHRRCVSPVLLSIIDCLTSFQVRGDLIAAGVEHDLADLAAIGDPALVERALKDGADANERDADGERALCAAAKRGHGNIVKMLLDNGADPNASGNGDVPLYVACGNPRLSIVELLLDAGTDPNGSLHAIHSVASPWLPWPQCWIGQDLIQLLLPVASA